MSQSLPQDTLQARHVSIWGAAVGSLRQPAAQQQVSVPLQVLQQVVALKRANVPSDDKVCAHN
jgi:hypothetical protein